MAEKRVTVTGRIIAVRSQAEKFIITVGPPPDMYWWTLPPPPPRLGQKVRVSGICGERKIIGAGSNPGSLTPLRDATCSLIDEPYPTRVVSDAWLSRCRHMMERPLYRYQLEGAAWLSSRLAIDRGSMLCDDMGLGKTAQVVAALCACNRFPALIVCPASLKEQWAREFLWARRPPDVRIIDGQRGEIPFGQVHIINYQLLKHRQLQLHQLKPRCIIFDEAHYLKEPNPTRTHRAAIATILSHTFGPAILLTGSPVLNRPQELWRLLHIVDKKAWPDFDEYRYRYCGVQRKPGRPSKNQLKARQHETRQRDVITKVGRVTHVDELAAKVAPLMLRRLKHQVLADLPAKSHRVIPVRLGYREMAHYRAAEKDVLAWLRYIGQNLRADRGARAKALVRLTTLRRIAALGKLSSVLPGYLYRWFDRSSIEPLVIFGYHRDVMLGIWHICQRLKIRTTGIGGKESSIKRQAAVDAFMSGWSDVFLAPIMCAGFGLNLQRAAEALFVERIWSSEVLVQAEDRIHRLGQLRPVTITYLDAVGTIDEEIRAMLSDKNTLVRAVVDGRSDHSMAAAKVAELMITR